VTGSLDSLKKIAESDENEDLFNKADIFCRAIRNRAHFGEVEAQVWRGGHLVMKSHTDGATAMLHLGLTLGGCRILRVGKFFERHSPYRSQPSRRRGRRPGDEVSVWNHQAYDRDDLWDIELVDGSAYLSLPFSFEHGVLYDEGSVTNPVVALQCRFAFVDEAEALAVNGHRTGNMRAIAEATTVALATAVDCGEVRMPSLQEVKAAEAQLTVGEALSPPLPQSPRSGVTRQVVRRARAALAWDSASVRAMAGAGAVLLGRLTLRQGAWMRRR